MRTELDALKKRLYGGATKAKNVKFFPGHNNDSTPEDMARQMNIFFADPKETETDGELSAE
jgi:hypothetical protein